MTCLRKCQVHFNGLNFLTCVSYRDKLNSVPGSQEAVYHRPIQYAPDYSMMKEHNVPKDFLGESLSSPERVPEF